MADLKVYGAPWCPDCRRAKQFLGEQRVRYDWIDIDADANALRYVEELQDGGRRIPTIVFRDGSYLLEPSNDELAARLGLTLVAQRRFYDLIIIGGGPAGLTAAIYGAREGMSCLVVEKSALGGNAGVTERIDNYPGFPEGVSGADLSDRMIQQAGRYDVELLSAVGVQAISPEGDDLRVDTDGGDDYGAHAVIVATGSTYRRMGVPGEDKLIGAGVHFCATCDGPFYRGAQELMVIGGGNSGLEEGLFLTQFAESVRILEHGPDLKGSQLLQDKVRNHPRIVVQTSTEVVELKEASHKLAGLVARDLETGEEQTFNPAAVFVFIGLVPNTAFLEGQLDLDPGGFVLTDDAFQTSIPGVFAAGDVRAGATKQVAAAVGEGASALLQARQHLRKHSHLSKRDVAAA